jgi:hypothetical protein
MGAVGGVIQANRKKKAGRQVEVLDGRTSVGVGGGIGGGVGEVADVAEPRSANFGLHEFHCEDGTPVPPMYYENVLNMMMNLEVIRGSLGGNPIYIVSGYRTPQHNAAVGGSPKSQHLEANAVDMVVEGLRPIQVYNVIKQLMETGDITPGGLGLYATHVHYDQRGTKTYWDAR